MPDGYGSLILMVVLMLAFFLGLWLLARYFTTRVRHAQGKQRYLRTMDTLMLGKDRAVVLVQAGEQYFVVGVTGQSVTHIATLRDGDLTPLADAPSGLSPGGLLSGLAGKWTQGRETLNKQNDARAKARTVRKQDAAPGQPDEMDDILYAISQRKTRMDQQIGTSGEGLNEDD